MTSKIDEIIEKWAEEWGKHDKEFEKWLNTEPCIEPDKFPLNEDNQCVVCEEIKIKYLKMLQPQMAKAIKKDLERHHSKEANWFRWLEFTKEDWYKFWKKYGVGEENEKD